MTVCLHADGDGDEGAIEDDSNRVVVIMVVLRTYESAVATLYRAEMTTTTTIFLKANNDQHECKHGSSETVSFSVRCYRYLVPSLPSPPLSWMEA